VQVERGAATIATNTTLQSRHMSAETREETAQDQAIST
jgi:hypothetical protein